MSDDQKLTNEEQATSAESDKSAESVGSVTSDDPASVTEVVESVEVVTASDEVKPVSASDAASWYVVHAQSGFEMKAKEALEQRIKTLGFEDKIFDVVIPMRDIVVIKKGKKRMLVRKFSRATYWSR